jgi:hypothetical protein
MSNHIPDDLSIPPFLNRTSASDDEALPKIRVEAYDKINYWRDKLDQTAKLNKRGMYERAAADLSLEAECESNLGAVQAIRDEIYFLGRDHAGLCDDDIQYIMDGAKAKAERPIDDRADKVHSEINWPPQTKSDMPPANLDIRDAGDDTELPPPRGWLLGNQFCRGFLSSLVAPGAAGKTALRLAQLLSLAIGRNLTGQHVFLRCRVLLLSFEDGRDELQRRIAAALLHHNINRSELKGWLYYATPKGIKLAELQNGSRQRGQLEQELRANIKQLKSDIVCLDPYVKTHALEENDNNAMDFVCELLASLADDYNIAVDAPHHSRKGAASPGDPDMGRGGSSIRDAGRLVYTLTPMSEDEAKQFSVEQIHRRYYVRLDSAKVNIAPPSRTATWFKLVGVNIGNATELYPNGDDVQTVEPWNPPDTWANVSAVMLNAVLTEIENGMPNGQRYTDKGGGTGPRAA